MKKAIPVLIILLPLAVMSQGKQKDCASYCFETYRLWSPSLDGSGGSKKPVRYVVVKNDSTLFLIPMDGVDSLAPLLAHVKAYRLHYDMTVGVLLQTDSGRKKINELLTYTAFDLADTTEKMRLFISPGRHSLDEYIRSGTGPEKYLFFSDWKPGPVTGGAEDEKPQDRPDTVQRRLQVSPRDPKNPLIPITMTGAVPPTDKK